MPLAADSQYLSWEGERDLDFAMADSMVSAENSILIPALKMSLAMPCPSIVSMKTLWPLVSEMSGDLAR